MLKEQELIDKVPLPCDATKGKTPEFERSRHQKWMQLPAKARAAIRRLHTMLGHQPTNVLAHILKGARVSEEYVEAARLYRCDACTDQRHAETASRGSARAVHIQS